MPRYCPAGDGVFDEWVEQCPECGRELRDAPPEASGQWESDAIVWLVTAPNEPEALMWADAIRAEHIPVFVRAGGPGVGAWASAASFEHELLVRERDLVAAHRIVREVLRADPGTPASRRNRRASPVTNPARKRLSGAGQHRTE